MGAVTTARGQYSAPSAAEQHVDEDSAGFPAELPAGRPGVEQPTRPGPQPWNSQVEATYRLQLDRWVFRPLAERDRARRRAAAAKPGDDAPVTAGQLRRMRRRERRLAREAFASLLADTRRLRAALDAALARVKQLERRPVAAEVAGTW